MTFRLFLLIAIVSGLFASVPVRVAQGIGDQAVSVEIVLDASGSMAQTLPDGRTRMETAKGVLNQVFTSIPDRDGINVGLRIYGHEGDNTEAGRAVSCDSSDLIVPLDGVDRQALSAEVEQVQPTGWTPLALSLEAAADDFVTDKEATNAIILLTDGLETCDGDPCAVSGQIRSGNAGVITNVVGFALAPEEQDTVACIADEGGGQLLGAADATELSSALFEVLDDLEIVTGPGYLGGNGFSVAGTAAEGEVALVSYNQNEQPGGGGTDLPFLIHNNSGNDVVDVQITLTVRSADGSLLSVSDALLPAPYLVTNGSYAFGNVLLQGVILPEDADLEWDISTDDPAADRNNVRRDLSIVEAGLFDNRIVGTAENTQGEVIMNAGLINAICLDLDGNVLTNELGYIDIDQIDPGDQQPFQVDTTNAQFNLGVSCPAFFVAASGFGDRHASRTPTPRATRTPAPAATATAAADDGTDIGGLDDYDATPRVSDVTPQGTPEATTSEPTEVADDRELEDFRIIDGATRGYFWAAGSTVVGYDFAVLEMESEDNALAFIDIPEPHYVERYEQAGSSYDVEAVDVTSAFENIRGYTGTSRTSDGRFLNADLTIVYGPYVYLLSSSSTSVDEDEQLESLLSIAELSVGNETQGASADDIRSDGAYGRLPTGEELPQGADTILLIYEQIPQSYDIDRP